MVVGLSDPAVVGHSAAKHHRLGISLYFLPGTLGAGVSHGINTGIPPITLFGVVLDAGEDLPPDGLRDGGGVHHSRIC